MRGEADTHRGEWSAIGIELGAGTLDTGSTSISQREQYGLGLDATWPVHASKVLVLSDGPDEDLAVAHDVRGVSGLVHPNESY
jgi:hypothetical protein